MKILVFQRVLPRYRFELLKELSEQYPLKIVAAVGDESGAQRSCLLPGIPGKMDVEYIRSFSLQYRGFRRSTYIPFYPQAVCNIHRNDVLLIEGTTNFFNNIWIIPLARLLKKKIIWWDAGCSEPVRPFRRKVMDVILSLFIRLTHSQIAYSSNACDYMRKFMGANNCIINVNTIATSWFDSRRKSLFESAQLKPSRQAGNNINLIYVGAVEARKNLEDLVKALSQITELSWHLKIIGGGAYLKTIKENLSNELRVEFLDPLYGFSELESFYSWADYSVLPGEGGLSIIQAIQFGVPQFTVLADGTEKDYIDDGKDGFLCRNASDMAQRIFDVANWPVNKKAKLYADVSEKAILISSEKWVSNLTQTIESL